MNAAQTNDQPRVGVPWRTTKEEKENQRAKYDDYLRAVREAGGEPVEISLSLDAEEIRRVTASLDAVVLPGSPADVDPARYGAARHAKCADPDAGRERTDFALLDDAFANDKPVLAICYGVQLLNVRLGGALYQDIAGELHTEIRHSKEGLAPGAPDPMHAARIQPGGEIAQLAAACGLENSGGHFDARVNSSHHQAIREPGSGLRVTAVAADGVVEAVEHEPHKHWVVGVQWHPERMGNDALAKALFRALVQAARATRARR